jgi:hypothetical protein
VSNYWGLNQNLPEVGACHLLVLDRVEHRRDHIAIIDAAI